MVDKGIVVDLWASEDDAGGSPVKREPRRIELGQPRSASTTFLAAMFPPRSPHCRGDVNLRKASAVTELNSIVKTGITGSHSPSAGRSLLSQGVDGRVSQGLEITRSSSSIVVSLHFLEDGKHWASVPLQDKLAHERPLTAGEDGTTRATSPGADQLQGSQRVGQN